jgi:hypothetical protein
MRSVRRPGFPLFPALWRFSANVRSLQFRRLCGQRHTSCGKPRTLREKPCEALPFARDRDDAFTREPISRAPGVTRKAFATGAEESAAA